MSSTGELGDDDRGAAHPRVAGRTDARHDFTAPMFREKRRRRGPRRTVLRATPTSFGLLGRTLMTAVLLAPLALGLYVLELAPKDDDGQFYGLYFFVVPSATAFFVLFLLPLWRPGLRYRTRRDGRLSRLGTRRSSSRRAPR